MSRHSSASGAVVHVKQNTRPRRVKHSNPHPTDEQRRNNVKRVLIAKHLRRIFCYKTGEVCIEMNSHTNPPTKAEIGFNYFCHSLLIFSSFHCSLLRLCRFISFPSLCIVSLFLLLSRSPSSSLHSSVSVCTVYFILAYFTTVFVRFVSCPHAFCFALVVCFCVNQANIQRGS